jgi:hypothetical protein
VKLSESDPSRRISQSDKRSKRDSSSRSKSQSERDNSPKSVARENTGGEVQRPDTLASLFDETRPATNGNGLGGKTQKTGKKPPMLGDSGASVCAGIGFLLLWFFFFFSFRLGLFALRLSDMQGSESSHPALIGERGKASKNGLAKDAQSSSPSTPSKSSPLAKPSVSQQKVLAAQENRTQPNNTNAPVLGQGARPSVSGGTVRYVVDRGGCVHLYFC